MSRSFLAAIRNAMFSAPDAHTAPETSIAVAASVPPARASAPTLPIATHPAVAADHGRFAIVAQAEGIAGNPKRLSAALELAAIAPEMSTDAIIEWTNAFVPTADAPARTIPTLMERAEEAQRQADALGSSRDKIQESWNAAVASAHERYKMN